MIAVLKQGTTPQQAEHLMNWLKNMGLEVHVSQGKEFLIFGLVGDTSRVDMELLSSLEMVESVKRVSEQFVYLCQCVCCCYAGHCESAQIVEACNPCYAQVWGGVACAPHFVVNALKSELVAQEAIFVLQICYYCLLLRFFC